MPHYTQGMKHLLAPLVLALPLCLASNAPAQENEPSAPPSATRTIETIFKQPGSRVAEQALVGLRRLRDPALTPFFSALASGAAAPNRRHGILGLAEISTPARLNPLMLSRLEDPGEQAFILGEALANDLVSPNEIEQFFAWPKLDPFIELALRARLHREGAGINTARVTELADKGGVPTQLLSALLLAQAGNKDHLEGVVSQLLSVADPERGAILEPILTIIRRENLSGASKFLADLEILYRFSPALNADLHRIHLRVAPTSALPAWKEAFEKAPSLSDRLRLAAAALDAASGLPPEAFAPVEAYKENEIVSAMGAAGRAIAEKKGIGPAVAHLVKQRYKSTELWAAERAADFEDADAIAIHRAILLTAAGRGDTKESIAESCVTAAAALAKKDHAFLTSVLADACARFDEPMCYAILTGMLKTDAPQPWDVAQPPRWPDGQTEKISIIVIAKSLPKESLDEAFLVSLEQVAIGLQPILPPSMRAQAAWLHAKLTGQDGPLLARMLTGE